MNRLGNQGRVRLVGVTGLTLFSFLTRAQLMSGQAVYLSARSAAVSGAIAALPATEARERNPAGPAFTGGLSLATSLHRPFGLSELDMAIAGIAVPIGAVALDAGFQSSGFDDYGLTAVRIGLASRVRRFAAGAGVRLAQQRWDGYESLQTLTLDLGWMVESKSASLAGAVRDVFGDRLEVDVGLSWFGDGVRLLLLATAGLFAPPDVRIGVEATLVDTFVVRFGGAGRSTQPSAGIGLAVGKLAIDFAVVFHPRLGASTVVSVQLRARE